MAQKRLRILCLGDSLTAGYTAFGTIHRPYCEAMESHLRQAFPDREIDVIEDGMDGASTINFSERLTSDFRQAKMKKPFDWTIVLGGTNDLAYPTDPEIIFERLEKTWSNAILRKSKVLALTVPEVGGRDPAAMVRVNARRDALNNLISGYVHKDYHAFDFYSVFQYSKMTPEEQKKYYDDGVRFTEEGYNLMGKLIATTLIPILEQEQREEQEKERQGQEGQEPRPRRRTRAARTFKDDNINFEEEGGSPQELCRGYVVVRRKDLD